MANNSSFKRHPARSASQGVDQPSPVEFSDRPSHGLWERDVSWRIHHLNQQLSKCEGYVGELCQLLPDIRKEMNALVETCRQVPSTHLNVSEALADDGRQVTEDQSDDSEYPSVHMFDPVLPDDATKTFTLQDFDSNDEFSEVKVQSDDVAVNSMKLNSGGAKRKRVGVHTVFSTLAKVLKQPYSEGEMKGMAYRSLECYSSAGPNDRHNWDFPPKHGERKGAKRASHEIHTMAETEISTAMDGLSKTTNHSCTLPVSQRPCWCEITAQSSQ
jgi:hypothetical protein